MTSPFLEGCDGFVKPYSTQHSPIDALKYYGDYYAEQTAHVCGPERTLGSVVRHFSNKSLRNIFAEVHKCCRNKRGGVQCENGYCVPLINKRAACSLLRLLLYARQHPHVFSDANIIEPSAEFHKLIQTVEDM